MSLPAPLIEAHGLSKAFRSGHLFRRCTQAVREVSFTVSTGKTLAVVGESGCGKTTLARLAAGLIPPDQGAVSFSGRKLRDWSHRELRPRLQMIFQDADGSLNPNLPLKELLLEPLRLNGTRRKDCEQAGGELLQSVGLTKDLLRRYPHELSGGQRQRLGVARAISLEPDLIIADEPVTSLDRSVQAHILSLLKDYQRRKGVTYLYISHDLATVRALADQIAVMLGGVFVEAGPADKLLSNPLHPYTRLLLNAAEDMRPKDVQPDIEELQDAPPGCPFAPLCLARKPHCARRLPDFLPIGEERSLRCFQNGVGQPSTAP